MRLAGLSPCPVAIPYTTSDNAECQSWARTSTEQCEHCTIKTKKVVSDTGWLKQVKEGSTIQTTSQG